MKRGLRRAFAVIPLAAVTACSAPATTPNLPISIGSALLGRSSPSAVKYKFQRLDDPQSYSHVNQLSAINNEGKLVGFYGNGTSSDASRGFVAFRPYGRKNFHPIDYPLATNTWVTAVNEKKVIGGYYTDVFGKTYGFTVWLGLWATYEYPKAIGPDGATYILAVNDADTAVGYFKTRTETGSFTLDLITGVFSDLQLPGRNGQVTGINGQGDIVGFTTEKSKIVGFIRKRGTYTELSFPRAKQTQFFSIATFDMVGGSYVDGGGSTHGFLLLGPLLRGGPTWQTIDFPGAAGTTVVAGINIHEDLVGYYLDSGGISHGFVATPTADR